MDSTPTDDRGPGSTGPAQTAFDALPSGHKYVLALGTISVGVVSFLSVLHQLGSGDTPGPFRILHVSAVQVWRSFHVAPLVIVLMLAAVLRPRQSALAMTGPRWLFMGICVAISLAWVIVFEFSPSSVVVSVLGTLAMIIPQLLCAGLLWFVARAFARRSIELWAGLAVMASLLYCVWSMVTVLGAVVPALDVPVSDRIAAPLMVLLSLPITIASALIARHALASINRSEAGATTLP